MKISIKLVILVAILLTKNMYIFAMDQGLPGSRHAAVSNSASLSSALSSSKSR